MSQSASRLQHHIAGSNPKVENIEITVILTSVEMGDINTMASVNIMFLKIICVFIYLSGLVWMFSHQRKLSSNYSDGADN